MSEKMEDAFQPEPMAEWLEKNKGKTGIENFKGVDMERFITEQRGRDAEGGNVAKLREALEYISSRAEVGKHFDPAAELDAVVDAARAALAAPPRNCDVGTVKEQVERLCKFCEPHVQGAALACTNCKLKDADICELAWANAPYDAAQEGAEG